MNVYVYPFTTNTTSVRHNPYLLNFITSLEPHCNVVNRDRPTSAGLFGVVPWLRDLDVLILHWADNIPDRRGALAQTAFLRALLLAKSALGVRVVYVLHNRVSHAATRLRWKRRILRALLKHADLVLTHAGDGVAFARENSPEIGDRVQYVPHPMASSTPFVSGAELESRRYDVLVWGPIVAYKGLADLVELLNRRGLERRYRILVAGQFPDTASYEALSRTAPYITFENRYIPDAELQALMGQSRIILFPYRPESLLGSASLMTSLLSDAIVIGPNAGAFRDCAELGLISTFGELSELPDVIARSLVSDREALEVMLRKRSAFAAQNTWERFGRAFAAMLGT